MGGEPADAAHGATTLDFADVDGIRVAVLADGATVRTFEQADAAGARYVVGLVRTPARELVFDYDGGRLRTVSHDGGTLFDVERDRDGRIAAVRDDHGRSVRYLYDADGRLETARDIAGSDWRHLTATTACSAAPSTRRAGPAWPPPTTTRDASRGRTADACTNTPTLPRARRSRRIRARCTR